MTAALTAALGTACSSASTAVVSPRDLHGSEQGSGTHAHGHEPSHASHDTGGHPHAFTDADAWTRVFDDPSRDAWQRPDEVLRALELEPTMVVADVGAGTGYFSVRLARAMPRGEVLATDLEPDMVRFLRERAQRERLPNLRAVQATPTASGLAAHSVDRILIVHVWHTSRSVRSTCAASRSPFGLAESSSSWTSALTASVAPPRAFVSRPKQSSRRSKALAYPPGSCPPRSPTSTS